MNYCPECGSKLHAANIDGNKRYICKAENCHYIYWNNPIPVVAALVKHDGKYLIARNASWPNNLFALVTGYLEYGEEPENAVLREVAEELGLEGKILNYLGHHMFSEKNQLILAFEVEATGNIRLNEELAELKFLTPEALAEYSFKPLYVTERIIGEWVKLQAF